MSFHVHLNDPTSLTQKLRAAAKENFSVLVLSEGFVQVDAEEVWRREVELCVDGEPWVHAVTLIPRQTLIGPGEALLELHTRSLGDLLATDVNLRRDPFAFSADQATRSSTFYFFGKPLVVTETFLPKALAYFTERDLVVQTKQSVSGKS